MLPSHLREASCGTCHERGARVPPLATLEEGAYLFELHGCQTCHEEGRVGPNLSGAALKGYDRAWQVKHLKDPGATVEGSRMMRFGHLTDDEVDTLVTYMEALIGAPLLARGKALAMELGCRGCHAIGGVGGEDGAELSNVGAKSHVDFDFTHVDGPHTVENWHRAHLRDPQRVSPGSAMPAYRLPERDEQALLTYILSLRRPAVPMELLPKRTVLARLEERRDFPSDGAAMFGVFCSACHGDAGQGRVMPSFGSTVPSITNTDLLAVASEGYLRRTLDKGRPGRHMPAWGTKQAGLSAAEVDALLAFIAEHRPTPPPFEVVQASTPDVAVGASLYGHDCAGCHGVAGEGTVIAPSLVNAELLFVASDRFLYETIAKGRPDTAMPAHGHYDGEMLASLIAWIRSHQPTAPGRAGDDVAVAKHDGETRATDGGANGAAPWDAPLAAKVFPRLFVSRLDDYRAGGNAAHGALLFEQTCRGCHGERGHGGIAPAIGTPGFVDTASDGFIAGSILLGRGQRGMRSFDEQGLAGMTESEVSDIIVFLRQSAAELGHGRPMSRVHANVEQGKQLYAELCVGCHGENGTGRTAPALNNQGFLDAVTDGFLQATIVRGRRNTAMRAWATGGYGFAELTPEEINALVAYIRSWHLASTTSSKGGS